MELSESDIAYIEKYWKKELNFQEKKEFEERMKEDLAFSSAVDDLEIIFSGIEEDGARQMQSKFQAWSQEQKESEIPQKNTKERDNTSSGKTRSITKWLSGIAAVGLLALAALFFLPKGNSTSDTYASYFEPYPDLLTKRGQDLEENLRKAMDLYNKKKYREAIPLLELEYKKPNPDPRLALYIGISCSQSENYACAQKYLGNLVDASSGNIKYTASWYKALDLLKAEKKLEARTALDAIAKDKINPFQAKAKMLLAEEYFCSNN